MKVWLNNATRRAKEGLMQAMGSHQTSDDTDFELRTKIFYEKVNELNKIKESIELWLDSFDSFCASTIYLGETIRQYHDMEIMHQANAKRRGSNYSSTPPPLLDVSKIFGNISEDINTIIRPVIRDMFVTNCMRPLTSMLALAPQVQEKIQERRKILFDVESYSTRIHKELAQGKDFNNQSVAKTALKLEDSSKNLAICQANIYDLFDLFDATVPTLLIEHLSSSISCLYHYHGSASFLYGNLISKIPSTETDLTTMQLAQNLSVESFPSNKAINQTQIQTDLCIPIVLSASVSQSYRSRPSVTSETSRLSYGDIYDSNSSNSSNSSNHQSSVLESQSKLSSTSVKTSPIRSELSAIFAKVTSIGESSSIPSAPQSTSSKKVAMGSYSPRRNSTFTDSNIMIKSDLQTEEKPDTLIPNPVSTHALLTSSGYTGELNSGKRRASTLTTQTSKDDTKDMNTMNRQSPQNTSTKILSTSRERGNSGSSVEEMNHIRNEGSRSPRSLSSSPSNLYTIHESNKNRRGSQSPTLGIESKLRNSPSPSTNGGSDIDEDRLKHLPAQRRFAKASSHSIVPSSSEPPPKPVRKSVASAGILRRPDDPPPSA